MEVGSPYAPTDFVVMVQPLPHPGTGNNATKALRPIWSRRIWKIRVSGKIARFAMCVLDLPQFDG
jgi:hypothetical protein